MTREITTINNILYLMDYSNQTFFKVEMLIPYEAQMSPSMSIDYSEINKISVEHELTLFSCIINGVEKWGCINQYKKEVIPCIYNSLKFHGCYFLEATISNPVNSDKYTSDFRFIMDNEGIPCYRYGNGVEYREIKFNGYQAIGDFKNGLAVSLKGGCQGIVKQDGSVFWESIYDCVNINDIKSNHIIVKKDNQYISFLYFENLKCWKNLLITDSFYRYDKSEKHYLIKREEKLGVMNFSYQIIIPPIYVDLVFSGDIIIATNHQGKKGIIKRFDYKTILLDFEYDEIYEDSHYRQGNLTMIKNGLRGVCSRKGEILIKPIIDMRMYVYPNTYGEGLVGFRRKKDYGESSEYGFINSLGEIVLSLGNVTINSGFREGKATITYLGSYGEYVQRIINKQGNIIEEKPTGRYESREDDYNSIYDSEYYNSGLDIDQQGQEFWEDIL